MAQVFGNGLSSSFRRSPSAQEHRAVTYLVLTHGASGLALEIATLRRRTKGLRKPSRWRR